MQMRVAMTDQHTLDEPLKEWVLASSACKHIIDRRPQSDSLGCDSFNLIQELDMTRHRNTGKVSALLLAICGTAATHAETPAKALPDASSPDFCVAVQKLLADTEVEATNTVFDNMPDYRASKPSPDPLMIYQVVTYDEKRAIAVSCKVKTADHLRATYGEDAAGEQKYCPSVTEQLKAQAIAELEVDNPQSVVEKAQAFIVDQNEPYMMGSSYLADFDLSYVDADGQIHLNSPGLQTNWDDWVIWVMPNRLRGQTYCHLPTVSYIKALATGAIEPGTVLQTVDDAPTKPPR